MTSERYKKNAALLGEKIRAEHGLDNITAYIERYGTALRKRP